MGPIILLLVTVVSVGLIAPHLSVHTEGAVGTAVPLPATPAKAPASAESSHEAWLTGGTVLDRQSDGHFYADANVNSHQTHFLVDTGASIVALTGTDAQAIGLTWADSDIVRIGQGASGTVYGVPVRLDHVELGGFEADDVQAAIIPDGLSVSLLGQSFLSKLRGVRIDGDRMIVGGDS